MNLHVCIYVCVYIYNGGTLYWTICMTLIYFRLSVLVNKCIPDKTNKTVTGTTGSLRGTGILKFLKFQK